MKRIMIVGGPGSGKSTLARWLGAKLDLPVFHMDKLHWKENWVERPSAEKIPMAREIEAQEHWVFEGGMSATYASRMARADMVIWLDLPVGLRLWRVTKRLLTGLGKARPDLPAGCVERLHPATLEFYRFIWRYRHISRDKIASHLKAAPQRLGVRHLRSPAQVAAFQDRITAEHT